MQKMFTSPLVFTVCLVAIAISETTAAPQQKLNDQLDTSQNNRIKKRSYSPWGMSALGSSRNSISLYNAGNVYKPAQNTIPRPYYIPVYGVQGGNLLFYPPQPIYVNMGFPPDNPPINHPVFQGPTYLPPRETPTQTDPTMMTGNRFGGDDDDDDAPIWGNGMGRMPLSGGNTESSVVPTRPPMASNQDRPSLVHDTSLSQAKEAPGAFTRPETQPAKEAPAAPGPGNCVWAIISCCSTSNPKAISQNCFEQRGCPGPFWGGSPCDSEYAKAAIDAAVKYYGSSGK